MITSNLPFEEWTEIFGTERLTGALPDRLTHHVNIVETNVESCRLNPSRARFAGRIGCSLQVRQRFQQPSPFTDC